MTYKVETHGDAKSGFTIKASCKETNYVGPCMEITHDKDWLHLETDSYEGHAMINIEALPAIIKALRLILKSSNKSGGTE